MREMDSLQRDLLYILAGNEGVSGKEWGELAEDHLGRNLKTQTVYAKIRSLVEKDLVEKIEGGRSNEYFMNRKGIRKLQSHREWQEQFLSCRDEFDLGDSSEVDGEPNEEEGTLKARSLFQAS